MTLDFDHELQAAIAAAASLYGPRDETFKLLPVAYHQKTYAQSQVNEQARTISVKLADPTPFADKDSEAKYELWHEAVHCLAPVETTNTLWFEEGVALRFGLDHAPLSSVQKRGNRQAIRPPWKKGATCLLQTDHPSRSIKLFESVQIATSSTP